MGYYDILQKRGFIYQCSDEKAVRNILDDPKGKAFYIGFDPTADSLHLGSMFALMSVSHLAKAGLTPVILMGGGTGLVGDPSGKTEMRNMLSEEDAQKNLTAIEVQIRNILPKDPAPVFVNNADWLRPLLLVDFLRETGKHFSINRMLTQDCVKSRMETGISYLEFSYMLLQAYDFAYLAENNNCVLQIGGSDQWGNMIMGMELSRRAYQKDVHCMTYELIMTATGEKMGKSAKGAIWLDPKRTSPYDYYQYWINVADADVKRFMYRYTYIEDNKIEEFCKTEGVELNKAKQVLAYEATALLHGEEEANKAKQASEALFSGTIDVNADLPGFDYDRSKIEAGISLVDLLVEVKLCPSKSEARRLVNGGGAYVNNERVDNVSFMLTLDLFKDGICLLRAGKKKYLKLSLK